MKRIFSGLGLVRGTGEPNSNHQPRPENRTSRSAGLAVAGTNALTRSASLRLHMEPAQQNVSEMDAAWLTESVDAD
jgi:hypothetical protein